MALEEVLAAHLEALSNAVKRGDPEQASWQLGWAHGALETAANAHLIPDGDIASWRNRFLAARTHADERQSSPVRDRRTVPSPAMDQLVRQQLLPDAMSVRPGIHFLSYEEYDDGFALNWLLRAAEESAGFARRLLDQPELDISITDDIGTGYRAAGSSASATSERLARGTSVFVPAPPVTASELSVRSGNTTTRVILERR